jgi:hypothetical protein
MMRLSSSQSGIPDVEVGLEVEGWKCEVEVATLLKRGFRYRMRFWAAEFTRLAQNIVYV